MTLLKNEIKLGINLMINIRNYFKRKTNLTDADIEKSDPIIYNDTDSSYCTITPLLQHMGISLHEDNNINNIRNKNYNNILQNTLVRTVCYVKQARKSPSTL